MKLKDFKKLPKVKKSKYNSTKCNGYDSIGESNRAVVLRLKEKQGIISDLKEQVTFTLIPSQYVIGFNGNQICARRAMKYKCDFTYVENGVFIVEDFKGFISEKFKQKMRLMKRIFGIDIRITK